MVIVEMVFLVVFEIFIQYGNILGGEYIVFGMGKFGGCELSVSFDLDIMVVYDYEGDFVVFDGVKLFYVV